MLRQAVSPVRPTVPDSEATDATPGLSVGLARSLDRTLRRPTDERLKKVRLRADTRRGPAASGKLLCCLLTAVLLGLSACGGGGAPPPSGGQPPPQPEPPGEGGFVPDREIVVAFPALLEGRLPP